MIYVCYQRLGNCPYRTFHEARCSFTSRGVEQSPLNSSYPFRLGSTLARSRASLFSSLQPLEVRMLCSWRARLRFFFRNLATVLPSFSTSLRFCSRSSSRLRSSLLALRPCTSARALALRKASSSPPPPPRPPPPGALPSPFLRSSSCS